MVRRCQARSIAVGFGLTAALFAAPAASARALPPLSPAAGESWLFAQDAARGTMTKGTSGTFDVTLRGVRPKVLAFQNRPGRRQKALSLAILLQSFFKGMKAPDPPNGVLSVDLGGGRGQRLMGVEFLGGSYDAKNHVLRYHVQRLQGGLQSPSPAAANTGLLPRSFGHTSVFIDGDILGNSCVSYLNVGEYENLTLTSSSQAEHDTWVYGPLQTIYPYPAQNYYIDGGGFSRGCASTLTYSSPSGTITVVANDPWTGSNTATCTATGNWGCQLQAGLSTLGGNELTAEWAVCYASDQPCFDGFGARR